MSRSSIATDGPWKNCSTDRPSVATRDVSRIFSAPSAAVHWFGPAPVSSSRRAGGPTPMSRASAASTALGDVLELERGAERARELGEPHQRAEMAGCERGRPLLLDRLDVDTRRAAASDHDRRSCAGGAERLEDRGRESLRVPVAHTSTASPSRAGSP